MTTVAWDGTTLAVDRQADLGGMLFEDVKLLRPHQSIVLAACGRAEFSHRVAKWLADGSPEDSKPELTDGDGWSGIMVQSGVAWLLEDGLIQMPITGRLALGSGKCLAMAAMDHGQAAPEAILYASTRDAYTGFGVDHATWAPDAGAYAIDFIQER